ncbi:major urinary protein 5-like isoform X3 [Mus musculus]|uniref:major urinary protein 5-like isoform X3 n=1 Tax=Mus musculus TaxID=10090 RepID=UPI0000512059|nr:major urinary protein 5-like isoform X3 [Mus musculus]|eukprot:XP_011248460.1 PREDICTED: major urinary protein 5-like isoform X3 [Mus musculus]
MLCFNFASALYGHNDFTMNGEWLNSQRRNKQCWRVINKSDWQVVAKKVHMCFFKIWRSRCGPRMNEINGEWYTIILASDKREKIEEHGSMRLFVEHIHVLENSLGFKLHTVDDGFNTFTILKTEYDNYIMFHLINEMNGETFQLMLLYDLEPDLRSDIKEEFAKLFEEHGIVRENSIDLSNANHCLQALE